MTDDEQKIDPLYYQAGKCTCGKILQTYDYVRHLSKEIIGDSFSPSLFGNQNIIRNAIVNQDVNINIKYTEKLKNAFTIPDISYHDVSINYLNKNTIFYNTLINLFKLNLNTTDNTRTQNKDQIFLDISNAPVISSNPQYKIFPLYFTKGDRIIFRITYSQSKLNYNISNKSYKIILRLS